MKQNKSIPNAKDDWLFGNLRQIKANLFQALCDWQHEYGDLLAGHPEALGKLRRELEALPKHKTPEANELQQLSYARAILNESMRILPPVGVMMRNFDKNTAIEGYALKARSLAIFGIYNINHHPDFGPSPAGF